jgi:mono/diheme cytochrome c family protein
MPVLLRWAARVAALSFVPVVTTLAQPPAPKEGTISQYVGSDMYKNYCAACHGASARGDGPLADRLKKRPPDLTLFARNNAGVYPADTVRRIIDGRKPLPGHGGGDMPIWGDAFKFAQGGGGELAVRERIDAIVGHLETLQVKSTQ